jgi:hypothetical protein
MSWWTKLRDAAESAAVVAGNYYLPGSSLLTSKIVSKGSQEQLSSPVGQIAQLASGAYGVSADQLKNYGTIFDKVKTSLGISGTPTVGDLDAAVAKGEITAADAYLAQQAAAQAAGAKGITAATFLPYAATLGGAALTSQAIGQAAQTQADYGQQVLNFLKQQQEQNVALQEPFRQAGITALNKLVPLSTEYKPFTMAEFQADPGYTFRLAEGKKALERQAAARGGLISGAALKAATRYGQEMGSEEFMNAFNRYQLERQAQLSPLQYLVGGGQTSAQTLGSQAQQYGRDVAGLTTDIGASQAGAQMARGTTYAQALTGAANLYGQQQANALNQQLTNAMIARLQSGTA